MIVEDILAFSKLESKTFTLHEKIFKLDDAIYNASDIVAKKIYKKVHLITERMNSKHSLDLRIRYKCIGAGVYS